MPEYQRLKENDKNLFLRAGTRVRVMMKLTSGVCRCKDNGEERYWIHEDKLRPETSQEVLEALLEGEW